MDRKLEQPSSPFLTTLPEKSIRDQERAAPSHHLTPPASPLGAQPRPLRAAGEFRNKARSGRAGDRGSLQASQRTSGLSGPKPGGGVCVFEAAAGGRGGLWAWRARTALPAVAPPPSAPGRARGEGARARQPGSRRAAPSSARGRRPPRPLPSPASCAPPARGPSLPRPRPCPCDPAAGSRRPAA